MLAKNAVLTPGKVYRPDIDGLRAIAVLFVVIYHAFPSQLPGGFVGVDIFFVISGYLITGTILDELHNGSFSIRQFYVRRARRIFPALIVVLASCAIFGWFALTSEELNQLGKHIFAGIAFISNLVFWSEAGYFDFAVEYKPLLHLWSLGVEEQYYLIWPLMLSFLFLRRMRIVYAIVVFALVSFSLNILSSWSYPTAAFFSPVTRFWELLLGAVLASASRHHLDAVSGGVSQTAFAYFRRVTQKPGWMPWVGLAMLLVAGFGIDEDSVFPGFWVLLPVVGAMLIISGGQESWLNKVVLSARPMVWVGLISYPLYLWHWPIISFGHIFHMTEPHRDYMIAAVVLSILLAWLTYKFVEPAFRYRPDVSHTRLTALLVSMCLLGVIGGVFGQRDFSETHIMTNLTPKRQGAEHFINGSTTWYEGKENWLFLGNRYDDTVAKLRGAKIPSHSEVATISDDLSAVSAVAANLNTRVALLIGPNKASVYPEFLPDEIIPAKSRYLDFFLRPLSVTEGLTVFDPTNELAKQSKEIGPLYWRTDTHWNHRGAYIAYAALMRALGLDAVEVEFRPGNGWRGGLTNISGLKDYPIQNDDDWIAVFEGDQTWEVAATDIGEKDPFGARETIINTRPVVDQHVWVVGDSFVEAQRGYLNATFAQVDYIGHWKHALDNLPNRLAEATRKPDLIIIVKVERSF